MEPGVSFVFAKQKLKAQINKRHILWNTAYPRWLNKALLYRGICSRSLNDFPDEAIPGKQHIPTISLPTAAQISNACFHGVLLPSFPGTLYSYNALYSMNDIAPMYSWNFEWWAYMWVNVVLGIIVGNQGLPRSHSHPPTRRPDPD